MKKTSFSKIIFAVSTIILLALTAGLVSCNGSEKPDHRLTDKVRYSFIARSAKYMWANNVLVEWQTDENGYARPKCRDVEPSEELTLSQYLLFVSTCNVSAESIGESADHFFPYYSPLHRILGEMDAEEGDRLIKNQLEKHYNDDHAPGPRALSGGDIVSALPPIQMEYRTTPIRRLSVSFSADLGGIKAGNPLDRYLSVDFTHLLFAFPGNSGFDIAAYTFIVAADEKVYWPEQQSMTLEEYMSYSPMAPTELFLKFGDDLHLTEPATGFFTLTMETDRGDILTAITRTLTLRP